MSKVRVGLIGCGGRLKRVISCLNDVTDGVSYVGICDPDPESVSSTLRDYCPDAKVYPSVEELVSDESIDWVMIGTPNYCHAEQVIVALQNGKHVFCEKPLVTKIEDISSMKIALDQSNREFVLGLTLRHAPFYRKIREWLDSGRIGKLISMEFNETIGFNHGGHIHSHPWRRKTAFGGSHMLEKCCHDLDLALWMVGSLPKSVASFGGKNFFIPDNSGMKEVIGKSPDGLAPFTNWKTVGTRVDPFDGTSDVVDNQVCIMEFYNSVRAMFHTNCISAIPERRICLLGTMGAIRGDVLTGELEFRPIGWDAKSEILNDFEGGDHGGGDEILAKDLADVMHGRTSPKASLQEGIASAVTCFALNDAMKTNSVVDCFPYWQQVGISDYSVK